MGASDRLKEMKDKADRLAEQAKKLIGSVPGPEAVADAIDDPPDS